MIDTGGSVATRSALSDSEWRQFDSGQIRILERLAAGAPLNEALDAIVGLIEEHSEGVCSILLVDNKAGTVHHGAARRLPREYMALVDGSQIGPDAASCGTAAYRNERVVVADVDTHPAWARYKHLAQPFGLRACWSSPIADAANVVLGTFAVYYREPRDPEPWEIELVDRATHLAGIAIKKHRDEEALNRTETLLRRITETSLEGVVLLNREQRVTYANLRAAEIFHAPVPSLNGSPLSDFLDDGEDAAGRTQKRLAGPRNQYEARTRAQGGWVIISQSPILDDHGALTGTLVMLTDITLRKIAELALAKKEADLRRIFESIHDVIFYVGVEEGEQFRFLWVNRSFFVATGLTPENVEGRLVNDVIPEPSSSMVLGRYRRAIAEKRTVRWEEVTAYPAGKKYGEVAVTPVWDADERCVSLVGTVHDLTEYHRLHAQLALAQKLESLGTLAGGITHDFNNIIAAIMGNVALAQELVPATHKVQKPLEIAMDACDRAGALVRRILTFSPNAESSMAELALAPIVSEVMTLLQPAIPAAMEVHTHVGEGIPAISGDAAQIHQIVMNLVTNALQSMTERGTLGLQVERAVLTQAVHGMGDEVPPGEYARLTVSDTGAGMTWEVMERIFEPFFTTKTQSVGTGLGLSVVHGIVKKHRGAVVVESEPGRGSRFQVYFPALVPTTGEAVSRV